MIIELYNSPNITVKENEGNFKIGFSEDINVKDLISVVNFQLGVDLLVKYK